MVAYTFELMAFIDVNDGRVTMYTRQTVLENLSPYILEGYRELVKNITDFYITSHIEEENEQYFDLGNMMKRLEEKPSGYDFVLPYQSENGLRYKQVNVLWGDRGHRSRTVKAYHRADDDHRGRKQPITVGNAP